MDLGSLLVQIDYAILMVILGFALSLLRQWLLHYMSEKTLDQVEKVARAAVAAAEQFIEENPDKLEWTSRLLHEQFPQLSEDQIRMYIERAVFDLNLWFNDAEE